MMRKLIPFGIILPFLLVNPSFEGGWTRDVLWWDTTGGPYAVPFGEIFTPDGWTSWFIDGASCSGGWVTGRPEIGLIDATVDPNRIRSGNQAAKLFTFWRCHRMGLMQRVEVEPGAHYDASIWFHSWYSNCSTEPYEPPLDYDCETWLYDSHDLCRIGIDPTGGRDPRGESVAWGEKDESYGEYAQLSVRGVEALSETVTVIVECANNWPLKHNDVYLDDAEIVRRERIFVPYVARD